MQEQNFNAMMLDKKTKWADLNDNQQLAKLLQGDNVNTDEARKAIGESEKPIPQEMHDKIQKFIG